MKRVMFGLVALAAIALVAPAQEQTPKQTKEVVWTVQIRGISG